MRGPRSSTWRLSKFDESLARMVRVGLSATMKTSFFFPICDFRRFSQEETGELGVPTWPLPTPDVEFVRSFGPIRFRKSRELSGWQAEEYFCDVSKNLVFHSFGTFKSMEGRGLQSRITTRRFVYDGLASSKVEICFETIGNPITKTSLRDYIKYLCQKRMSMVRHSGPKSKVGSVEKFVNFDIATAARILATEIAARTSYAQHISMQKQKRPHIVIGRPTIICNLVNTENFLIDDLFQKVNSNNNNHLDAYHDRARLLNRLDVPIWALVFDGNTPNSDKDSMTSFVGRLHVESQNILSLVRALIRGDLSVEPRSSHSDAMQSYLNKSISKIKRLEKLLQKPRLRSQDDPNLLDMVTFIHGTYLETENVSIDTLNDALEKIEIRRNIALKTSSHARLIQQRSEDIGIYAEKLVMTDKSVTTNISKSSNIVSTPSMRDAHVSIDNSFSSAQNARLDEDVLSSLADLKKVLDQIVDMGQLENPEQLARDYEELCAEVKSDVPRKEKAKLSGKLILDTVGNVSGMVTSASKAIEKLITAVFG